MILNYHSRLSVIALSLLALFLFSCQIKDTPPPEPKEPEVKIETISLTEEPKEPEYDNFGFDTNLFNVEQRRVQKNETLSLILQRHNISHSKIYNISKASQGVYNLRRIVAGKPLHFYTANDSLEQLRYMVYERDAVNYVVFDLKAPYTVELGKKEVTIKNRLIEGEIQESLYESFLESDADPRLAYALADLFAWQIDFYQIREGDSFKVLFEERMIEGKSIGVGNIRAADFIHRGNEYNAMYFEQNGNGDYYDKEGKSLRKAFLRAPLEYSRISSRFSNNRRHPILKTNRPHHGTDYAAPTGTAIRAVGDGQIVHAAYDRNNGNYIKIRHNSTYETGYLHMSKLANGMRNGTRVSQGDIIGYVGSTGLATGPHLCYRFWKNSHPVDPYRIDLPSSNPVEDQYMAEYEKQKKQLLSLLDPEPEPESEELPEVSKPGWQLASVDLKPQVFSM
ncbi:MAG: peptidoglycan DD-metalloendopeptidase family protein [Balneolales bacterium]